MSKFGALFVKSATALGLATALFAAPVLTAPVLNADTAKAEEKKERRKPPTRQSKTLSKPVFDDLQEAQELLGEGKHAEAKKIVEGQLDRGKRIKDYDRAVLLQTLGFIAADREDYKGAAAAFKQCLDIEDGLPDEAKVQLMYNLGQLYMALEEYDNAIGQLTKWFKVAENPNANAYILLGNAYYNKNDFGKATKLAEVAIKKGGANAKENWFRFLLALYFEQNRYKHAEALLSVMVKRFPGDGLYWRQLSAVSAENKKEKRSFLIAELAYMQGMLEKGDDVKRLAQLYIYYDVPYKAAKMLEEEIKAGKVEKNADNWELLASSWMAARNQDKAIPPLTEAAKLSPEGDLYLQLGQAYVAEEEWDKAEQSLKAALAKSKLKERGTANLLLGITYANQENFGAAKKSFAAATKFDKSKDNATRWLNYIQKLEEQGTAG